MSVLRTREIFSDSALTIIAVESVESQRSKTNSGCHVYGNVVPIAVIVCAPDGSYALDMKAKPVNVDQFRRDIPELDARI